MTTIRFSVGSLKQAADRLERVSAGERLGISAMTVVNEVTTRFHDKALAGANANINLSDAYIKSKTDLQLASGPLSPKASIVTRGDLTILGRFAPLARVVAPGAQRRAGPVKGFRSAGTTLAVKKSEYVTQPQWFIMRLRAGNAPGDNFGVFVRDPSKPAKNGPNAALAGGRHRDGKAGKRHIYGPAPYQLFRHQIDIGEAGLRDDLAETALRRVGDTLEQAL